MILECRRKLRTVDVNLGVISIEMETEDTGVGL